MNASKNASSSTQNNEPHHNPETTQDPKQNDDKALRAQSMKLTAQFGNFGLFLIISILLTYSVGHAIDKHFGTNPWFTVFLIGCGIAASIIDLVNSIKKAKHLDD